MPRAFVIMPFADWFDLVYDFFINPALIEAGFDVKRADEVRSTQNILRDIIDSIVKADLIVADLTGSNPNVYYELGLAHILGKPVIMLSQKIEDLPFDLRSYRVVSYRPNTSDIEKARVELIELAKGAKDGTVPFGSPVADFFPEIIPHGDIRIQKGEPDLGVLNYAADLEEGLEELTNVLSGINSEMTKSTESTERATLQLQSFKEHPGKSPAREARNLIAAMGMQLNDFSSSLARKNAEYSKALTKTGTALEWIVRSHQPQSQDEKDKFNQFRTEIDNLLTQLPSTKQSIVELIGTFRSMPSIERSFERAKRKAIQQLEQYGDNIDQTISLMTRIKEILESKVS